MRKTTRVLMLSLALLTLAGSASAAVLPFSATITIRISGLADLSFSGMGVAVVNGSGGGSHLSQLSIPASAISTVGYLLPVTDPAAFPVVQVQGTMSNGPGAFATLAGVLRGVMPLQGAAKVGLFGPPVGANVTVPLGVVGVGGTTTATGVVSATVIGAPWTSGTVTLGTGTARGFAHGPLSLTTSTAVSAGALRLVTPIFISTNLGASPILPAFGYLDVSLGVPEPGTALLLVAGMTGLAVFGRKQAA